MPVDYVLEVCDRRLDVCDGVRDWCAHVETCVVGENFLNRPIITRALSNVEHASSVLWESNPYRRGAPW